MEIGYFALILIAIVFYSLSSVLVTPFARKYNGFTVTVYRNVSFLVTMSPLLLLSDLSFDYALLPTLFIACAVSVASFTLGMQAKIYAPVGISTSFRNIATTIVAFIIGYFILQESYYIRELALVIALVLLGVCLGCTKIDRFYSSKLGILLSLASGAIHAIAWYYFTLLARGTDPFLATYLWEGGIGICALIILPLMRKKYPVPLLRGKELVQLVSFSAFTIFGTTSMAFAVQQYYALSSSLVTLTIVGHVLFSWLFLKEKLRLAQLVLIGLICLTILVFKFI